MEPLSNARKITQLLLLTAGIRYGKSGACKQCGSIFTNHQSRYRLYCGRSCARKAMWANLTKEETQEIRGRIGKKNQGKTAWNRGLPQTPEVRAKLSAANKASGHQPRIRGGNGHVAPCEAMAREMLSLDWLMQYAIPTKQKRGSGYPYHYKADFANLETKKILEIDGQVHGSRKHLDAKKDELLESLGWSVYRVSNQKIQELYTTFKSTGHTTILSLVS